MLRKPGWNMAKLGRTDGNLAAYASIRTRDPVRTTGIDAHARLAGGAVL
jgi:hypothetical protein